MSSLYGLIGYPLTHSFSRKYFLEKFQREQISDSDYRLFELPDAADFPALFSTHPNLKGLNVTIPHKKAVAPRLDFIDQSATRVGAVNVIKKNTDGTLTGYNSDYIGFLRSLKAWLGGEVGNVRALILGTGGAAAAVEVALQDLSVEYRFVSRHPRAQAFTYRDLFQDPSIVGSHRLIINTSPVGTYPRVDEAPEVPYQLIGQSHYLYDLVYNPEETRFMKAGHERGAKVKNGYEMLVLQAERAWEIWNQKQ